jgi:hypothetical protein
MCRRLASELKDFRLNLAGLVGSEVWIEKVGLVIVGQQKPAPTAVTDDANAELRKVLDEIRSDVAATRAAFATGDCAKLAKLLPTDVRGVIDISQADILDRAAALLGATPPEQAP